MPNLTQGRIDDLAAFRSAQRRLWAEPRFAELERRVNTPGDLDTRSYAAMQIRMLDFDLDQADRRQRRHLESE